MNCPVHGTPLIDNGAGILYCQECHIGVPQPTTETPTPALRWKAVHKPITDFAGEQVRTLQQLWEIRDNGATRQEWRPVPEVQADALDI